MRRIACAAYRPREASTLDLFEFFERELRLLRQRGHVTQRPAPVLETSAGELIVILEWSSAHAVDDAHADPEVVALWSEKADLAEYVAPADLAGADVPFASWNVIGDA
jgi:hypothetical protein